MKTIRYLSIFVVGLFLLLTLPQQSQPLLAEEKEQGVRLKDLARISGMRTNQLLGYGIVAGLPNSGDSRSNLARESIRNLLGGLGFQMETAGDHSRNIAAVLVTAEVPPFVRRGDRLDVVVSSVGDARSLEGGVLIQTPLYGGNEQIIGVAQGPVTSGGGSESRRSGMSQPRTVVQVLGGLHIERDLLADLLEERQLRIQLNRFDFTTLQRVRHKISQNFTDFELVVDGGSLLLTLDESADPIETIARLEELRVEPAYPARVVINERSGVIVMGGDVQIAPVAVTRGGVELTVGDPNLVRPERMGIYVPTSVREEERESEKREASREFSGASVSDIVRALNEMGAGIRDVIAILEALRESGALHAEIVVQ